MIALQETVFPLREITGAAKVMVWLVLVAGALLVEAGLEVDGVVLPQADNVRARARKLEDRSRQTNLFLRLSISSSLRKPVFKHDYKNQN